MTRVMRTGSLGLVLTAIALGVSPGLAHNVEQVKLVFEHAIPNTEGKSMVAVVVTYPPGAKSPAHHHARSAFIYAHVLSGAIRSQVGDEPAKVYQAGEGFYELPGSHHGISENASEREPASLLAVFVVDSKDRPPDYTEQGVGNGHQRCLSSHRGSNSFIDDDGLVRPRVTMLAQNAGMRDKEIRTLQWDGFVYDELVELIYKHSR